MNIRPMMLVAVLSLSGVMISTGCKSAPPAAAPTASTTNPDGSITNPDGSVTYPAGTAQAREAQGAKNADGSITNPDGSITYPAGTKPRAVASAPAGPAYAGRPAAGAAARPTEPAQARVTTIPSGTRVAVSLSQTLSASRNNAGDSFSGVLSEPLAVEGRTIFPRGTEVTGTVAAAKGRGRFKGAGDLAIELTSIGGTRVSTDAYEKSQGGKGKRTAGMIGGGAGIGALIGGLTGGGKGALIGGLAGAGAGTAASAYTGNKDVVIPAESIVSFTLTAPVTVR
jgi:hypothetical protein